MGISVTKKFLDSLQPELDESKETLNQNVEEDQEEEEEKIYSKEDMLERGIFKANGYSFLVKPITFFESIEFMNSGIYVPSRHNEFGDEIPDRELGRRLSLVFKKEKVEEKEDSCDKRSFRSRMMLSKSKPESVDYSEYPKAKPMIEWMEKKISIDGKPIKFYELETKYMLTKGEIARMLIYLFEFSGF